MLKRAARAAIRSGLRHQSLRRVVEAELRPRPTLPQTHGPEPALDPFVDRFGVVHRLEAGYRDRLKPGWRTMLDPDAIRRPPADAVLRRRAAGASKSVAEAEAVLAGYGGHGLRGRILEVGCYDGAVAFQLAIAGAGEVVASDLARYYVVQHPGSDAAVSAVGIESERARLAEIRQRARIAAGARHAVVEFVEDDIGESDLADESFDLIVSFEVLEHLADPARAFQSMMRLLKPEGIAYHLYNPFLSIIGGHSLCTLDFPWGHGRLDPADLERYLRERRPAEAEQALRFYLENLNRMTLAELQTASDEAGLETVAVLPWLDRSLLATFEPDYLVHVRRAYPSAVPADLLATFVTVVFRRPGV